MADDPNSPLGGDVLFYKNPQPLNPTDHGRLGLVTPKTPFAFAAGATAVPLTVGEFGPASLNYPVVFAGADYTPLAVLGVRPNENLFVDGQGLWNESAYIPAFVRRYPFVYAHGDNPDQMVVCIDRDAETMSETPDVPFFVNGEPSDFTKQCLDFCANFEGERRKTDEFTKLLKELDLFEVREISFTPLNPDGTQGAPVKVSEHFSPSEERLKQLPESTLLNLLRSGALQQIHLHWNSLFNWERLLAAAARKDQPLAA